MRPREIGGLEGSPGEMEGRATLQPWNVNGFTRAELSVNGEQQRIHDSFSDGWTGEPMEMINGHLYDVPLGVRQKPVVELQDGGSVRIAII